MALEISLKDIDEKLKMALEDFKDEDYVLKWFCLSSVVILNTLGKEWWKTNRPLTSIEKHSFFSIKDDTEEEMYAFQNKIIYLGHLLYSLKDTEGFEIFSQTLKSRDVESCNWELNVAKRFLECGYDIRFIEESGKKENDYDLFIFKDNIQFQVEAKNRNNNANDEKSLNNVLNKARKQLPKDGNGIVYISTPQNWTKKQGTGEIIENIVQSFFRNTSRVKFVIIEWDEWIEQNPTGRILVKRNKTYENPANIIDYKFRLNSLNPNNSEAFVPSYLKNLV